MRTLSGVLLAAAALLVLAPSANANHTCGGQGFVVRVGVQGVHDAAYVAWDLEPHWWYNIWVYAESNGVPDLQRGGASILFGSVDYCQDSPTPDLSIL